MTRSGAETVHETVEHLVGRGEKVGVLKVRLYRPFRLASFLAALPRSTRSLAVLDRTKEPGALGDPLYLDVMTALSEARAEGISTWASEPRVIAGRYGLSSKEFTPAMVKAIFDELDKKTPRRHFTIGIVDDDAVAAGDGALSTWRARPTAWNAKSSTSAPSAAMACARTPAGADTRSSRSICRSPLPPRARATDAAASH
jgi:hypothetical protein